MGTALTDLLNNPISLGAVTNGIEAAITKSFRTHPMRHKTEAEVRRRFDICVRWFRTFRTDSRFKFSIDRCVNELPKALRAELDGVTYTPHTRALWTPGDS